MLLQFVLRQHTRARIDQRLQQVERFWREMDVVVAAQQLAAVVVEREFAEREPHALILLARLSA